jgi:hypothetical protein
MADGGSFTFLGVPYTLSRRSQILHIKGPWPEGRMTFTRGYSTTLNHDERAEGMLMRINKALARFEVRHICACVLVHRFEPSLAACRRNNVWL